MLGAILAFACYRILQLPDELATALWVSLGAAACIGALFCLDATPSWVRPPRFLRGGWALLMMFGLFTLAAFPVFGCIGRVSCMRPLPVSLFPNWIRAIAAGVVAAMGLVWMLVMLWHAVRPRSRTPKVERAT